MRKPYFLNCFHAAYEHVPAYKSYLDNHNIEPSTVLNLAEFQKVPPVDKKSYILKYPLTMLFPNNKIPAMGHSSSGSSGTPTLWFRGPKQRKIAARIYEQIFSKIFNIKKEEPTLVLICFAMGMWVAGTYTLIACQDISQKGYQITTFSVGMDSEAICDILKNTAPLFKNVILIGYPFFFDLVFEEVLKKKILIPKNIFIATAGDKFSEDWRKNLLNKISKPFEQANRVINFYGSSDAGILGYETPLSIAIRQETLQNLSLYKEIFKESDPSVLPTLIQYDPNHIFFEEKESELLLTADLDCPLIRYNIHDRGKVISFSQMKNFLISSMSESCFQRMANTSWKLPFLVIDTKTDVSVIFEAVKIYPEQIKLGMNNPKISRFLSGSFITYVKKNIRNENRLYFELELAVGINELSQTTKQEISNCIVRQLEICNSEFRNSMATLPYLTFPIFYFYSYGSDQFKTIKQEVGNTKLVSLIGKKSKLLA